MLLKKVRVTYHYKFSELRHAYGVLLNGAKENAQKQHSKRMITKNKMGYSRYLNKTMAASLIIGFIEFGHLLGWVCFFIYDNRDDNGP